VVERHAPDALQVYEVCLGVWVPAVGQLPEPGLQVPSVTVVAPQDCPAGLMVHSPDSRGAARDTLHVPAPQNQFVTERE
jgi:hypothetical protein